MPMSRSRFSYMDCHKAMEAALQSDKGVFWLCKTEGEAVHLRGRLNRARELDRDDNKLMYPDPSQPLHGRSYYDSLSFKLETCEGKPCVSLRPNNLDEGTLVDIATYEAGGGGVIPTAQLAGNDSLPLLPPANQDVFPAEGVEAGDSAGEDDSGADGGGGQGTNVEGTPRESLRRI